MRWTSPISPLPAAKLCLLSQKTTGFAREILAGDPRSPGMRALHSRALKRGMPAKKLAGSGRNWLSSFVFRTGDAIAPRLKPTTKPLPGRARTEKDDHAQEPGLAAAIAGAGVMCSASTACGQKPAPAEEAAMPTEATVAGRRRRRRCGSRALSCAILRTKFVATGRLVVREEAAVGSELPGYRVAAVYVDEGDWVKQGQAMAKLDDALLQAQIAQAEATLATQKANLDFKSQPARAR